MEQLGLVFAPPTVVPLSVTNLEDYLRGKGWVEIEQITAATGWDDRKIRAVASKSDVIITRIGKPGYCHADDITLEHYEHARKSMLSQSRVMIGRVVRWDRRVYARLKPRAK